VLLPLSPRYYCHELKANGAGLRVEL
jgi:hypothetical protein